MFKKTTVINLIETKHYQNYGSKNNNNNNTSFYKKYLLNYSAIKLFSSNYLHTSLKKLRILKTFRRKFKRKSILSNSRFIMKMNYEHYLLVQ